MARAKVTNTPQTPAPVDDEALAEAWQSQLKWIDHLLGLQTAWWMSCAALQSAYLQQWASAPFALPPWMIWHNGAEQLA
jgi:hypothetical protein